MPMKRIELHNSAQCCGCRACENICPKQAISMKENEEGFYYPQIDDDLCVNCGLCKNVCMYQNNVLLNEVKNVYAAASKDDLMLQTVASGGIFSSLALAILKQGGVVFGTTMDIVDGKLKPYHIAVEKIEELEKLKGSKYVQSDIGSTYNEAKVFLEEGRKVLFSGTPCQIAGLNLFLKKKYENLITIDIICHGVPSAKMFQDYIECKQNDIGGDIFSYRFRDKSKGQGYAIKILYKTNKGKNKVKLLDGNNDSYNILFLESSISRESCYSCKFAQIDRVSDITIGDFWGIYEEHDNELLRSVMSDDKGISCILVNSDKGEKIVEEIKTELYYFLSEKEIVMKHNGQLRNPVYKNPNREEVMQIYLKEGYGGLDRYVRRSLGIKKRTKNYAKALFPKSIKRRIKQIIK